MLNFAKKNLAIILHLACAASAKPSPSSGPVTHTDGPKGDGVPVYPRPPTYCTQIGDGALVFTLASVTA